ncbi:hypothetical protein BLNAU_22790 [Blattamonas nauphoetae]|uniref:Uncharacterized protein n=1 Tax=Blattamonas nauphoetae TaxID=2049346 RepID=A0ABQ9WS17_9EUKA|nr:hypothetical protein BLNAU_22790 [Blattamonas nauphoetae]
MAQHIKPTSVTDLLLDRVISPSNQPYDDVPDDHTHLPFSRSSSLPRTSFKYPQRTRSHSTQYSSRLPPRPPNTIRRPQRTILSPNSSHGDSPTTLHHPSKRLPSHVLDQSEQKEEAEKKIAKQAERPTTKAAISTKTKQSIQPESRTRKFKQITSSSLHSLHTFRRKEKNNKREEANVHAGQVSENKEDNKEDNGNDIIRKIKRRHPNSTGTDSTPKNDEKISIDLPSPPAISGPQNEGMISERTLKVSIKAQMRVRERGIAKLRERHLTRLGQPQTSRRGLQKSKRTTKKELPPDFFNLMSKRIKDLTDAQWDTLRRHSVCIQPSPIIDHQKIIGQIERNIRDDPSSVMDLPSHIFDHFRRSLHAPKRKRQSKKTIDINFGIDTAISRFPRSQPAGADTTMLEIHNPANSSSPPIDINFGTDTAISPFPRSQPAGADTTMLEIHNPANSSSPPIDINFGTDTAISPFPRSQPAGADTTMLEIHNSANSSSPPIDINFGTDTAISPSRDHNQPELTQRCSRYNPANPSSPPVDINFGTDTAISPFPRSQPAGADTTMLEIHNPANSSSPPIDINFGTDTAISPFPRSQPAGADTTMLEIHNPANSSSPPIDINFGTDTAISPSRDHNQPELTQRCSRYNSQLIITTNRHQLWNRYGHLSLPAITTSRS